MLDINWNLYKTFHIVAQSKSYSDAANKSHITTTAISKSITQLEKLLDTQLFFRTNNGVKLTGAGEELFKQIDKSMTAIELGEKILKEKNDLSTGKLVIGCPSHITDFYLIDIINEAKKEYSNLEIKIISGVGGQELIELLENHKIDFAIETTTMDIQYKDIVVEKIKEIENIFISKRPLKIKELKELENYKYILPFEYTSTTRRLVDTLNKNNVSIKADIEIDITELRIKSVKKDFGIGYVMKEAIKQDLEDKQLYEVKVPIKLPTSEIKLFYIKEQLTKADKQFIKNYLKMKI